MTISKDKKKSQRPTDEEELKSLFRQDMEIHGFTYKGEIKTNQSVIQRFSCDNKPSQKDEFYCLSTWEFEDLFYGSGYYGTWSGGKQEYYWQNWKDESHLSEIDRVRFSQDRSKRETEQKSKIEEEDNKRLTRANKIWDTADEIPSEESHTAYLSRKQVSPQGIRYTYYHLSSTQQEPVIVIPLRNTTGELKAVQLINSQGLKKIHGLKKGHFHLLGSIQKDTSKIYCSEGYATGASIYQAQKIPVVVAMDCNNIKAVIENLRKAYPEIQIIIAADDDGEVKGNPGLTCAQNAAKRFQCKVVCPKFKEDLRLPSGDKPTDFNDLFVTQGEEEVNKQLSENAPQIELKNLAHDLLKQEDPCGNFSTKDLPKPLREYIDRKIEMSDAHPIMTAMSTVTSISGIVGKRIYIPKGEFFQDLYPNIWVV